MNSEKVKAIFLYLPGMPQALYQREMVIKKESNWPAHGLIIRDWGPIMT